VIEGLKPYPAMKDSGVPWLGEVPEHWDVLPNRAIFDEVKDRDRPDADMLSVTITKGVIRQQTLLEDSSKKDSSKLDRTAYKLVRPGDIAYNKMRAWQGAVGVSEYEGIVSPAYVVQRPRKGAASRYMHYLLRTPGFAKEAERWSYGITSDMWSLRPEHFKMIYSCLPPLLEQAAIVRFLDYADRKIRRYIRAKQKLIKLLEEQKQASIYRAVTRGLDPDVRLKPSGVEWLGDVPEHWELRQVRRVAAFVTSGSRGWADYYSDSGLVFIQSGNLGRNMALSFHYIQHVQPPSGSEGERTSVQRDDLLVCITGALTGNVVHVDKALPGPSFVNQHVALVRVRQAVVQPRFLAFALRSGIGQSQLKTSEYGGTKQGLGLDDVKDVYFPLPPREDQHKIIVHLDSTLQVFNTAISGLDTEISLLREYRNRLIADVVTGKLDVREAAASLSEEAITSFSEDPEAEEDPMESSLEDEELLEDA
jgi:type I restriction enzyme S subunit